MPTALKNILDKYSEQDLESFARDKIQDFNHLRLPKSVLIDELYSLLTGTDYLNEKLAYRSPPSYEILHTLLNSPGYQHKITGFKSKVLQKTDELVNKIKTEERIGSGENYDLYFKMLRTAWLNEEEINPGEAKLLETLRNELNITFQEHLILEHHMDIKDLWDRGNPFQRERNHLLHSGFIFIDDENNSYVVPEEIAYQILDFWGIELDVEDYSRLLNYLKKDDLVEILDAFNLRVSGTKSELSDRIIEHHIPVSAGLLELNKSQVSDACKKVGCKSSGSKTQIIERLIHYVQYDRDLESDEGKEPDVSLPVEEKLLDKEKFERIFDSFTTRDLSDLLSQIPTLVTYGTKDEKIQRLWECSLSESSLLNELTKDHLGRACDELDLKVSGSKKEQIDRLIDAAQKFEMEKESIQTKPQKTPRGIDDSEDGSMQNKFQDVPNLVKVRETFPFLTEDKQVVLSSLIEFESLTEQEIDRIIARYELPWIFPQQEMEQLINSLQENGFEFIEKNERQEHSWYKIKNEDFFK